MGDRKLCYRVSVVIVNYNGEPYLSECLNSLLSMDKKDAFVEILMIDNLSSDKSVQLVREKFPGVKIIENDVNNFAKALNLGVKNSTGDYVAFINNDTVVDIRWLSGLLDTMQRDNKIGAVQSKILFSGGVEINSVGVEEVDDFYFRDVGFKEKDTGQYENEKEVNYFSGGSVMVRRECIDDVGLFDEDFIMFMEDIDYSIRCRLRQWKIRYTPKSIIFHKYHGTVSSELCEYFCSRNRLLCLAKHFPLKLSSSINTSHFYIKGEHGNLYRILLQAAKKLVEHNDTETSKKVFSALKDTLVQYYGHFTAYHFISHLEVFLGLRKIRVCIYDHAFHFAGGGQNYVAKMAEILQDRYEITYIVNKDITLEKYKDWFNIDLSKCKLKIIKIPFYENEERYFIDEGMVVNEEKNPFDVISIESLNHDILINANMLGKVKPLTLKSVFICHFPDRDKERFFHVADYDYLVSNSNYTTSWIEKRWSLKPTHCIYPPVNMYNSDASPDKKKKVIVSVARFDFSGSKKQVELVKAFDALARKSNDVMKHWRLVLAGGCSHDNSYLEAVKKEAVSSLGNIEVKPNINYDELRQLYCDASIFWHACGLNEDRPHLIEHFGMTTVEAMQNYCVPIVINGGGQKEIVEDGKSGFRFDTLDKLLFYTEKVVNDEHLRKILAVNAYERSHRFNLEVFKNSILQLFSEIESELLGVDSL